MINCGYSLIERFPLMLGTAAGVLLIGLVRWYLGTALFDSIARKLSSLMTGDSDDDGGRRSASGLPVLVPDTPDPRRRTTANP